MLKIDNYKKVMPILVEFVFVDSANASGRVTGHTLLINFGRFAGKSVV